MHLSIIMIFLLQLFPLLFILKEKQSFCYGFLFQRAKVLTLNAAHISEVV